MIKMAMTINNNGNHSRKILIVDDEPDVCLTFKKGIEDYHNGYKVYIYEKPQEALQNFKAGMYELVLLDIKMPEMDGFQLYTEMKKKDSQVKAFFITAAEVSYELRKQEGNCSGDSQDNQYCKLNKDMFLQKPIQIADLVSKIDAVLLTN